MDDQTPLESQRGSEIKLDLLDEIPFHACCECAFYETITDDFGGEIYVCLIADREVRRDFSCNEWEMRK